MANVQVRDDPATHRYLLEVDGEPVGLLAYRIHGNRIALTHAEIDPAMERRGLGSQLAAFALDDARRRGLDVLPHCPFVKYYVEEHPEYLELVPEGERGRLGL